jgi:hypothetical protein
VQLPKPALELGFRRGQTDLFFLGYGTLVQRAAARQGLDPSEPAPVQQDNQSPTETKNVPARFNTSALRLRKRPLAEKRWHPSGNTFQPSSSMHLSTEASATYATEESNYSAETRGPLGLPHPRVDRRVQSERVHARLPPRSTQDDTCDVSGGVHGHGTFSENALNGSRLCLYVCHKVLAYDCMPSTPSRKEWIIRSRRSTTNRKG